MGTKQYYEGSSCSSELQGIRKFIGDECEKHGFSKIKINEIVLAADEACANVIRHGYGYKPNGYLCVEVSCEQNKLTIAIIDNCKPFTNGVVSLDEKVLDEPGGLGLPLIHKVMDSIIIKQLKNGGNRMELSIFCEKFNENSMRK